MKESRQRLLRLIYDYDRNEGGAIEISCDGNNIGFDAFDLKNDIDYLQNQGYLQKQKVTIVSYFLVLTEKGERLVENGFQPPKETSETNFHFQNAQIQNSIIGNQASGNEFVFNSGASLSELQQLIQQKPLADQPELKELLDLLQSLEERKEPVPRSLFARFSNLIKKHTDLIAPIGVALVNILFQIR